MNSLLQLDTSKRDSQGFTRLELVAILATLALLGTLAAAAMADHRIGHQVTVCMANLRDLTRAWQKFSIDAGYFPPNPDDGNTTPGRNWVPGQAHASSAQAFNSEILEDETRSLLFPYLLEQRAVVFRCPADLRRGVYQGTDPRKSGTYVPAARSYSMNGAVGTDPSKGVPSAIGGPWLDNNSSHTSNGPWRTYGRFKDILAPSPHRLAILLDEDAASINDAAFGFGMAREEWIDWPATRHAMAGVLSFADGHVEVRHWVDERTAVQRGIVSRKLVPGSPDYQWLRERISARK